MIIKDADGSGALRCVPANKTSFKALERWGPEASFEFRQPG
ncbi:hypothetical protein I553_9068 [Mycobacterium xenopi 4042]|uniref:Uncharacterized protein n=1 Tax=Mycobacterium xenopi 4042 TaxID=1299334 RepID=X8APB4_MYCXE|nr:hypothetical protein I552_3716 [Mycobacterium xenopi 3993]EUA32986.1 hypothetical protein I553_9068 [Mycobacterium xenopi 4042]